MFFELLKQIIYDFSEKDKKKRKKTADVFDSKDRKKYSDEMFGHRGLKEPTPLPRPKPPSASKNPGAKPKKSTKVPTKRKPPWDRKRVIVRGKGLPVPSSETKLITVLVELTRHIDVRQATIAAGVLVRIVLEHSVEHYLKKHTVSCRKNELYVRINACAADMLSKKTI